MSAAAEVKFRKRVSTLLVVILTAIACLVLLGLIVVTLRLVSLEDDLKTLRDGALPRLAKLSQLSQEAAATISIAPALSAEPDRYAFETLLSRIADKETSQQALVAELDQLIVDEGAAVTLRRNGDLLMDNLRMLTDVVREQIDVRKRLETHEEGFRNFGRKLSDTAANGTPDSAADSELVAARSAAVLSAKLAVQKALSTLLDPNSARLPRNRTELGATFDQLRSAMGTAPDAASTTTLNAVDTTRQLLIFWESMRQAIYDDKQAELANDFKIKALVEENSLAANRMLSSAANEFWRANAELEAQIGAATDATRYALVAMAGSVVIFAIGNIFVWFVLKRRVFQRLDKISNDLRAFADSRAHARPDRHADEIGAISASLIHYMAVIDEREAQLAQKSQALERLSTQLAKYLSPQVYASIFSGKQEVKVTSSRKKLTIFFSDIADFTETADRLESEELSQLLNHYLTEMSHIALQHGATIDKYVGDAILVFFGDPETKGVAEDALACVRMAIAMRDRLQRLQDVWRRSGIEKPLQVRMGIHTGFCTVGNFGSEDRLDYTIVGSAVNTASRLQAIASPGEILISYETFALVREAIVCDDHGEIEVKGIAYPVATYLVRDSLDRLAGQRRHLHEEHPNVKLDLELDGMTSQDREQAAALLRRALNLLSQHD